MARRTQAQYDRDVRRYNQTKQQFMDGLVTGEMAQAQLCLFGYSTLRSASEVRKWSEEKLDDSARDD